MKLTQKQKNGLNISSGDNEAIHGAYDNLLKERMKELDPEFLEDLDEEVKGYTFWYG